MKIKLYIDINVLPTITFVALTYNHEAYVIQHLESIAYLIRRYEQTKIHDLVVSDDCSVDSTAQLVSRWIQANSDIFRKVTLHSPVKNVGTCKSFLRATENLNTDYVKITGGDDVYSNGNIFSLLINPDKLDIIGTVPLVLIDDFIYRFHRHNLIHAVANAVYSNRPFRDNLTGPGAIYTPGLIYASKLIVDERIRAFIGGFDLVEDLPTWIAITDFYPAVKYRLVHTNIVYYRRTTGSAYIISSKRVIHDHVRCRQHLFDTESNPFSRWALRNRIRLLQDRTLFNRLFDIGRLFFALELVLRFPGAIYNLTKLNINLKSHYLHYKYINACATDFGPNQSKFV